MPYLPFDPTKICGVIKPLWLQIQENTLFPINQLLNETFLCDVNEIISINRAGQGIVGSEYLLQILFFLFFFLSKIHSYIIISNDHYDIYCVLCIEDSTESIISRFRPL